MSSSAETKTSDAPENTRPTRLTPPDISVGALFKLASPIFVANLSIMGSATVDTIMAGRLGAEHLAAVALASATAVMIFISLVGILQGLSPIAGHHYGARKFERIGFELTQSAWLGVILTVIGMALILQTDFWVAFGQVHGNVALIAAVNRPKVTMYVALGMLAMKVPLNALFMYGLFGLPELGGAGAGAATAVNSWLSLAAYWLIWKCDRFYSPMRPAKFYLPDVKALLQHLKLGVPIGLSTFFEVSSFTLMAIFIARIGTIDVAAHQIVGNITATLYQVPMSLGIAVSVLVAQSLGSGHPPVAQQVTFRALRIGLTLAVLGALALYLGRDALVGLYTTDAAVHTLAVTLLIYGVVYHAMDACQTICGFALRGYRVTFWPMMVYGILLWAVGLGGGYWLGFDGQIVGGPFGAEGFWGATAFGLTLAGIALFAMAWFVTHTRTKEFLRKEAHA